MDGTMMLEYINNTVAINTKNSVNKFVKSNINIYFPPIFCLINNI